MEYSWCAQVLTIEIHVQIESVAKRFGVRRLAAAFHWALEKPARANNFVEHKKRWSWMRFLGRRLFAEAFFAEALFFGGADSLLVPTSLRAPNPKRRQAARTPKTGALVTRVVMLLRFGLLRRCRG